MAREHFVRVPKSAGDAELVDDVPIGIVQWEVMREGDRARVLWVTAPDLAVKAWAQRHGFTYLGDASDYAKKQSDYVAAATRERDAGNVDWRKVPERGVMAEAKRRIERGDETPWTETSETPRG